MIPQPCDIIINRGQSGSQYLNTIVWRRRTVGLEMTATVDDEHPITWTSTCCRRFDAVDNAASVMEKILGAVMASLGWLYQIGT